jgi:Phytanoyl-CoA dioxygenase (PhyH)
MVFTEAERQQFDTQGYVVARGVAPAGHLAAAIEEICAFHGTWLDDPSTWYRVPLDSWDVVPIHQGQAIWNNRALPAVHAAFAELLGTQKLWVSMDRTGFKPPARGKYDRDSSVHLDDHPRERLTDRSLRVQGMLYLTDTPAGSGAFECLPSFLPLTLPWLAAHPGLDSPDYTGHALVQVPGKAGDLVIWNSLLPHRGSKNRGATPRLTQYISMFEAGGRKLTAEERVALWRGKRVPKTWRDWPATVRDPEPGAPAVLDALGRKLLGLDAW